MPKRQRTTRTQNRDHRIPIGLIEQESLRHKIETPVYEKVLWLSRVLREIMRSDIRDDFVLMGGSAIVFFYGKMYRFSTDLDLDFVGNAQLGARGPHEIKQRISSDARVLKQIAQTLTMTLRQLPQKDPRFVQYLLEYPSHFHSNETVEIDISYRHCHAVLPLKKMPWPIALEGIVTKFTVNTLTWEELYAGKTIAIVDQKERLDYERKIGILYKRKVRHLFDLYFIAEKILRGQRILDINLLKNLVILFGMSRVKDFEYFRGNAIGSYNQDDIVKELSSVVPRGIPIPSVEEMKWTIRRFFDLNIYNWSKREHRFIEDFRNGNFRPTDLFGQKDYAKELVTVFYYKEILNKVAVMR